MSDHERNTSGLIPWQPGQSGNPGGKTSEHRKAEIRAAELAAKVQLDLVEALSNTLDAAAGDEEKLTSIKADVLKLLKDAQDRGYGSPKQSIDMESPDGSLTPPSVVQIVPVSASKASDGGEGAE
jgi:hypothetical protein